MTKLAKVAELVAEAYADSQESFGRWIWHNHVQVVANLAQELSDRFSANTDLAVAGALLHDFGDAFVHRHNQEHEQISENKSRTLLQEASYSESEIDQVIQDVIAPHSCRNGNLPTTLEGKILSTADAVAHLTTDFYIQFAWMHLPENKQYPDFKAWVLEKLERDFTQKIFFQEIKDEVQYRYEALTDVFSK